MLARAVVVLGFIASCGPTSVGDKDAGGTDEPPPVGTVTGTVWAPGNAIGAVPAGYEIPVAGAMVYFADDAPPSAIPDEVYCDRCELHPAIFTATDAKGRFTIGNVSAGPHRLVIEKAQFRLETMIDVPAQQGLAVPPKQTTLPSEHAPSQGKWTPRVAIAISGGAVVAGAATEGEKKRYLTRDRHDCTVASRRLVRWILPIRFRDRSALRAGRERPRH